jgi:hypothetical protein
VSPTWKLHSPKAKRAILRHLGTSLSTTFHRIPPA